MVFENGVKNIQAAAYNGARTVFRMINFIYSEKATKSFEISTVDLTVTA